jgi:hypothetical protein
MLAVGRQSFVYVHHVSEYRRDKVRRLRFFGQWDKLKADRSKEV